jgi:hypothetical protein
VISKIDLPLPTPARATTVTTTGLKRYDVALDAFVCGWIDIEYLEDRCTAIGDSSAAIWTLGMPGPMWRWLRLDQCAQPAISQPSRCPSQLREWRRGPVEAGVR